MNLTEIEINILRMLAGGMTTAEIAFALDITRVRVEKHVADIFNKLNVSDTNGAVTAAVRSGLIPTEL